MIAFRKIIDVCRAFGIEGDPVRYKTFTDGHINSTFLVVFREGDEERKYLVQNINTVYRYILSRKNTLCLISFAYRAISYNNHL